jgi:N-acetyl-anhydromuramyl-L-alanine amidase AmpD
MFTKKWLPSPFFESRGKYPLDMVIIHHIGSQDNKLFSVNGTLTWFTDVNVHKNKSTGAIENKVSAHYVIPRQPHNGNDLYQLVKETDIAYHAGVSQWVVDGKLRNYINRYSVGIEMEGDGNLVEYTDYQYEVLAWLVKDLIQKYNIPDSNIVGHEEIAPGRKVDPGKFFDWKKFRTMLHPPVVTNVVSEDSKGSKVEPSGSTVPPPSPPQNVKPPTPTHTKDEHFFMEDGSRTHGGFLLLLRLLLKFFVRS